MSTKYIYLLLESPDFFFTIKPLESHDEFYSYSKLFSRCDCEKDFAQQISILFQEGYDLISCENYNEIKTIYCPPQLREWEKQQYSSYKRKLDTLFPPSYNEDT